MHFYSNSSSAIAMISSIIMLELLPACFSCSKYFILSHSLLGSDDKNLVF